MLLAFSAEFRFDNHDNDNVLAALHADDNDNVLAALHADDNDNVLAALHADRVASILHAIFSRVSWHTKNRPHACLDAPKPPQACIQTQTIDIK